MIWSRIVGTGSYLPERIIDNHELSRRLETNDEWIQARTGIVQRHIAAPEQKSSDLALIASQRALAAAQLRPSDVDLIIVATSTPDCIFPSTACALQAKLGAHGCPAFDVQAVCSGFVFALATADCFIRSGQARTALVVGAETFSRIVDWRDRSTCVLFGDGAGAVVLSADSRPGVMTTVLHADGRHADALAAPGTISDGRIVGTPFVTMNGSRVFRTAVRALREAGESALAKSGLSAAQIDWLVPHQANIRIIQAVGKALSIDADRTVVTVDKHGNTAAASVPLALDVAIRDGRIREGHNVLLQAVGAGFTWGAAVARI